ncbi:MAG: AzlC family ABC transporter permease [Pseudomonadota bacterium]
MAENQGADVTRKSRAPSVIWFFRGTRNLFSIPAFILMMSFVGFGALAREAGLTVTETMVLAVSTWALPSAVVVVGSVLGEAPFYAAAFAVALASVRLMPMTMSIVPVMRGPKTKLWHLVFASNFIAITAWVYAMNRLPQMDRDARLPFFLGFGVSLAIVNTVITGVSHTLVTALPDALTAGLLFLTPIYFLVSMTQASRVPAEYWAIGLGLILGPAFFVLNSETALLFSGLIGGTIAYLISRYNRRKGGRI